MKHKVPRRPIIQLLFASNIDFEDLDNITKNVLERTPEVKTILQLKGNSLFSLG